MIDHDPWQRRPRIAWLLGWRCLILALLLAHALVSTAADMPLPSARGKIQVVVLSDFNESYGSVRYSRHVDAAVARTIELKPDLVISTGDMVAGQRLLPLLDRAEIEAMRSAFHQRVSGPLARAGLPFAVAPGNHDASSGSRFVLERQIYREQWATRRATVDFVYAGAYPFRYAFRVGDVLFASLDATRVGHLSVADKDSLRRLLAGEGRRYRYRVVFSHLPLWPFSVGRENEILGDAELEAILHDGGVDPHLSGHHHAFYPGFKDGVRYASARPAWAPVRARSSARPGWRREASPSSTLTMPGKSASRRSAARPFCSRSSGTRCRGASSPGGRRSSAMTWRRSPSSRRVEELLGNAAAGTA